MTRASEKKRLKELKGHIRSKHYHATFEPLFEDVGEIDLEGYEWIVIGTETGKRKGKVDAIHSFPTRRSSDRSEERRVGKECKIGRAHV